MSIILCTQHKGGAGKTTLAVHLAGLLATQLNRILLIDCDTQRNAWLFYIRSKASSPLQFEEYSSRLSILWNPDRKAIRRIADIETYDHIILDMGTPLPETVKIIVDNYPDKIFVPVSSHPWALEGLADTLPVIAKLEEVAGFTPVIKIIPLGSYKKDIKQKLGEIQSLPSNYQLALRMKDLGREFNRCLKDGELIWNCQGLASLQAYFKFLLR